MSKYRDIDLAIKLRKINLSMRKVLEQKNLKRGEWEVLKVVAVDNIDSPAQIANELCTERATISRLLDGLEEKNFIAREYTKEDRRVVQVKAKQKGLNAAKFLGSFSQKLAV